MGAAVVLHKSQMGTLPIFPSRENEENGKRPQFPAAIAQCESEPAARRISGAATWDSSLR